jgi:DNA-binding HxlR family transcriptional regulator
VRRTRFDQWPCSIARVTDLVGDWWTPLVLREAYLGARRFDEFHERLGIGRNVLTERLRRLVDEGFLERRRYADRPVRHEYVLTRKGLEFFPVLAAMMRFGDDWLAPDGPPMELVDAGSGEVVRPVVVDERTGEPLDVRALRVRAGPGVRKRASGSAGRGAGKVVQ